MGKKIGCCFRSSGFLSTQYLFIMSLYETLRQRCHSLLSLIWSRAEELRSQNCYPTYTIIDGGNGYPVIIVDNWKSFGHQGRVVCYDPVEETIVPVAHDGQCWTESPWVRGDGSTYLTGPLKCEGDSKVVETILGYVNTCEPFRSCDDEDDINTRIVWGRRVTAAGQAGKPVTKETFSDEDELMTDWPLCMVTLTSAPVVRICSSTVGGVLADSALIL